MAVPSRFAAGLALLSAALLGSGAAKADAVTDFYKGKTVRVIVGFDAGGGYDLYARIFAQFFPKFMPGNPVLIVQNMPGAGSVVAAKHMFSVAAQDGTTLGTLAQTLPLDNLLAGDSKDFDAGKLPYIGRFVTSVDLGLAPPGASFKSYEDAMQRELVGGASGTASTAYLLPMALVRHGGAKFKVIAGYKGSNDIFLAAERKEVDFVGSINLSVIMSSYPDWVSEKKATFLYQGGLKRHPLLPWVPCLPELGKTAEDKAVLTAIATAADVGRAINTTPNVPADRLAALRQAFDAMVADKEFLADMEKRKVLIEPLGGAEVDKIAQATLQLPANVVALTKELINTAK